MIELVFVAAVILCNVVGFYHGANKLIHNSFLEKICDSMLMWILGGTIGIVGTIAGWIYRKIERANSKKESQTNRDNFYMAEYGAKEDELEYKIRRSPNVQKIADEILKKVDKYCFPAEIIVNCDNVHWFVESGNNRVTHKISFQDLAIAPLPIEHERTLAQALADIPSIKMYWEYNNEIDYCERLCLRREYRLNGLNKW